MKVVLNIIKYLVVILLTLSILAFIVLNIASTTILNKQYILNKLEETEYYAKIYNNIQTNFKNYVGPSGLEEEIFKGILTEEKVKKDTEIIIGNLYDGITEKIITEEIKNNLKNNIEKYLSGIKLTESQRQSIDKYIEKISDEYTNTILHTEYEQTINLQLAKMTKYSNVGKRTTIISTTILIILLIVLNKNNIYRGISQLGIAANASGIIYIVVDNILNSKIKVQKILIFNEAISETLKKIITEVLKNMQNISYVLIILGILIIIVGNVINSEKNPD